LAEACSLEEAHWAGLTELAGRLGTPILEMNEW
jgi:hypothetical protein